jgi:rfaE bifunctional protein kinase chain/domain
MNEKRCRELLEAFKRVSVTVLGDFILDEYLMGDTGRVSREAPVVVVNYRRSRYHPGGAANAARNAASLGAGVEAVGVVGRDREGERLRGMLMGLGVGDSGLLACGDICTALKMRVMAGDLHAQKQQVARIDKSYELPGGHAVFRDLADRLEAAVSRSDAVLISDYGMGVVPGELGRLAQEAARTKGIPLVVDSRFHLLAYDGATVATPNEVEALEALELKRGSDVEIESVARTIIERTRMESIIITRGNLGMFVLAPDGEKSLGVIGSDEATDVTGAGDTVAATVALTLAAGGSVFEAAEMATMAASVVVMKRGTAAASPEEIAEVSTAVGK